MRYCRNCGRKVDRKATKCPNCGWDFKTPLDHPITGFGHNSNAILFSVLSISTCFLPGPGVFFGAIGIYLGIRDYIKGAWITGIIGTALSVTSLILWVVYGAKQ